MLSKIYTLALCLLFAGLSLNLAVAEEDPVVIRVGDRQQTRSDFEQHFGVALLMNALSIGTPIKSGMQIRELREHYFDQRITELLLLQVGQRRGIQVSESELAKGWFDFTQSLPREYGQYPDPAGYGIEQRQLREHLREQLLIGRIRQVLIQELYIKPEGLVAGVDYMSGILARLRAQYTVSTCIDCLE